MTKTATSAKERRSYGMEWSNGRATCANTGGRYGVTYHAFSTASLRDEWCEGGTDYVSQAGFRESITSADSELRRDLRLAPLPRVILH